MDTVHTIGRRKTSIARIFIIKGKGSITVNKKIIQITFQHLPYNIRSNNLSC